MTLSELFTCRGIDLFASVPADAPPILKPRLLARVPGAKSAVFAAIPYYVAGEESNLAMFARARDYHVFAAALAEECAALLSAAYPGAAAAGFADHSPYAEVAGAALAGLGAVGDNGLLITGKYSSYVFLFSLITTLTQQELAAQGIAPGPCEIQRCLRCGACKRACPGGCIGGGRGTCLSAISQKKGELSPEEADALRAARYAWGCDACQDACPMTAAALRAKTIETRVPYFREGRILRLTPEAVARMSEEEYASYAFGWRKKEVMLRNLCLRKEE